MRIAYLVHTYREYDETIETINQLIRQGDHVFIMINDNDLRDKIRFVYAESQRVHISSIQEYAQEGDLSMARGTILQLREAVECKVEFDYYINLSDGMMPIKPRNEIVDFLSENNGKNFYYVDRNEKDDPQLRKDTIKYYPFTNLIAFPTKKVTRKFTRVAANMMNTFGAHRTLEDEIQIGSPWFMLSHKAAFMLSQNFDYVSEAFKLSWYAEEMYIPMMMKKFYTDEHVNNDYRVVGPNGSWEASSSCKQLTKEIIDAHPEALFAGAIYAKEDPALYSEYFDIYNKGCTKAEERTAREITDDDIQKVLKNISK